MACRLMLSFLKKKFLATSVHLVYACHFSYSGFKAGGWKVQGHHGQLLKIK
jgi:hypothetical protein